MLDFVGFGLSAKPRDSLYSVFWQADIVERVVGGGAPPVIVVAHDMGTSVETELLARDLEKTLGFNIRGVLLFNVGMQRQLPQPVEDEPRGVVGGTGEARLA